MGRLSISGYDIRTGTRIWSHVVSDTTGRLAPQPTSSGPTYTGDCHTLVDFATVPSGEGTGSATTATLVVDLATGGAASIRSDHGSLSCVAAGEHWAACPNPDTQTISSVDLADSNKEVWVTCVGAVRPARMSGPFPPME